MSNFQVYQGGIPSLQTRRQGLRQQGSGFLSGLKRFLMPIAKKALPHIAGAVGDLVSGEKPLDVLKARGRAVGADLIDSLGGQASTALRKGIKRGASPQKSTKPKQRRQRVTAAASRQRKHWQ